MSKLIGKGSYGCVYKPPIKCEEPCTLSKCNTGISKIMVKNIAEEEYENYLRLKLPPSLYYISDPFKCNPVEVPEDCNVILNNIDNYFLNNQKYKEHVKKNSLQLIYDYGGISLQSLLKDVKTTPINLDRLLVGLIDIFKAVMILQENNVVHNDISLGNIILDDDYNFKLIDFGISLKGDNDEKHPTGINNIKEFNINTYMFWPWDKIFIFEELSKLKAENPEKYKINLLNYYRVFHVELLRGKSNILFNDVIKDIDIKYLDIKNLENIFNNMQIYLKDEDNYNIIASKIDVYSIGIVLLYIIYYITPTPYNIKDSPLYDDLLKLIYEMINLNTIDRLTISQAYNNYEALLIKYFPDVYMNKLSKQLKKLNLQENTQIKKQQKNQSNNQLKEQQKNKSNNQFKDKVQIEKKVEKYKTKYCICQKNKTTNIQCPNKALPNSLYCGWHKTCSKIYSS